MKRYYFNLVDSDYNDLGASIPDGSNKKSAINKARKWMQENGIKMAYLQINSMITDNILELKEIEL